MLPSLTWGRFIDPLPLESLDAHQVFDEHNNQLDLREIAGIRVINFWASWCAPCVHELPTLIKLADSYKGKGVNVVLVNEDIQPSTGWKFLKERGFLGAYQGVFDPQGQFLQLMKAKGLPVTVIVDSADQVRHYAIGDHDWNSPEIHQMIDVLRAEKPLETPESWWQKLKKAIQKIT